MVPGPANMAAPVSLSTRQAVFTLFETDAAPLLPGSAYARLREKVGAQPLQAHLESINLQPFRITHLCSLTSWLG